MERKFDLVMCLSLYHATLTVQHGYNEIQVQRYYVACVHASVILCDPYTGKYTNVTQYRKLDQFVHKQSFSI